MKNDKSERFEPLECLLPCDREHAVSMKELAKAMEISPRELRQLILDARMEGLLILSDRKKGYWESDDVKEVEEFVRQRRQTVKKIITYSKAMLTKIKRRERHNEEK